MQDDRDHCSYKDVRDHPDWRPSLEDIRKQKEAAERYEFHKKAGRTGAFECISFDLKEIFNNAMAESMGKYFKDKEM